MTEFFAVDVSYSTQGKILEQEAQCVRGLSSNNEDTVCRWDTSCDEPQMVLKISHKSYWAPRGGTQPESILLHPR